MSTSTMHKINFNTFNQSILAGPLPMAQITSHVRTHSQILNVACWRAGGNIEAGSLEMRLYLIIIIKCMILF